MITKTTMVVILNLKNSHLSTLSLPTEEFFQVDGQNRPLANLPAVDFHVLAERNPITKATESLSVFLLVYWFFPLLGRFEPHSLSSIRIFKCFSRHNS